MEYITCTRCGQTLHCKWLYYVKPARDRRILRELAARKNL